MTPTPIDTFRTEVRALCDFLTEKVRPTLVGSFPLEALEAIDGELDSRLDAVCAELDREPRRREPDWRVRLIRDSTGRNLVASLEDGLGHDPIASGWCSTPEAALVDLCEKARADLRRLGATSVRTVNEDGETDLYVWLSRTFT